MQLIVRYGEKETRSTENLFTFPDTRRARVKRRENAEEKKSHARRNTNFHAHHEIIL